VQLLAQDYTSYMEKMLVNKLKSKNLMMMAVNVLKDNLSLGFRYFWTSNLYDRCHAMYRITINETSDVHLHQHYYMVYRENPNISGHNKITFIPFHIWNTLA